MVRLGAKRGREGERGRADRISASGARRPSCNPFRESGVRPLAAGVPFRFVFCPRRRVSFRRTNSIWFGYLFIVLLCFLYGLRRIGSCSVGFSDLLGLLIVRPSVRPAVSNNSVSTRETITHNLYEVSCISLWASFHSYLRPYKSINISVQDVHLI